jgi:hypothetical protein
LLAKTSALLRGRGDTSLSPSIDLTAETSCFQVRQLQFEGVLPDAFVWTMFMAQNWRFP